MSNIHTLNSDKDDCEAKDVRAPTIEPGQEGQVLVDDNTCSLCFTNALLFRFAPCGHWASCETCLRHLVTKTFTSEEASHKCMFCNTPVNVFVNMRTGETCAPIDVQKKYPQEVEHEAQLREQENWRWREEITESRDTEVMLALYENPLQADDGQGELVWDESRQAFVREIVEMDRRGRERVRRYTDEELKERVSRSRSRRRESRVDNPILSTSRRSRENRNSDEDGKGNVEEEDDMNVDRNDDDDDDSDSEEDSYDDDDDEYENEYEDDNLDSDLEPLDEQTQERKYIEEANALLIDGLLDYEPSDESDPEEKVASAMSVSSHPMNTRKRVRGDNELSPEDTVDHHLSNSPISPPRTRTRVRMSASSCSPSRVESVDPIEPIESTEFIESSSVPINESNPDESHSNKSEEPNDAE
ncbi:MAG: hypothetical protein Sylvanvirus1_48 [Sylvanvirus sp.]|uniref:RING-type domain-containing protein n=1 Tax=Sylvanvirus sp. TaxID=2487774 RepID=A0A3G5AGX5_9VIRU|nr:MAG: hypothetical protein Sylvanvirus1_48 [Sylvanvirus sp.]